MNYGLYKIEKVIYPIENADNGNSLEIYAINFNSPKPDEIVQLRFNPDNLFIKIKDIKQDSFIKTFHPHGTFQTYFYRILSTLDDKLFSCERILPNWLKHIDNEELAFYNRKNDFEFLFNTFCKDAIFDQNKKNEHKVANVLNEAIAWMKCIDDSISAYNKSHKK